MRIEPKPRAMRYFGMPCVPVRGALGTWLEPEEFCYPNGGMKRRARVVNTDTGRLVVVRCGIPDTFFTIPVRGGGYIDSSDGGILRFNPPLRSIVLEATAG